MLTPYVRRSSHFQLRRLGFVGFSFDVFSMSATQMIIGCRSSLGAISVVALLVFCAANPLPLPWTYYGNGPVTVYNSLNTVYLSNGHCADIRYMDVGPSETLWLFLNGYAWQYDFATNTYTRKSSIPGFTCGCNSGMATCFFAFDGFDSFYAWDVHNLWTFNATANTWSQLTSCSSFNVAAPEGVDSPSNCPGHGVGDVAVDASGNLWYYGTGQPVEIGGILCWLFSVLICSVPGLSRLWRFGRASHEWAFLWGDAAVHSSDYAGYCDSVTYSPQNQYVCVATMHLCDLESRAHLRIRAWRMASKSVLITQDCCGAFECVNLICVLTLVSRMFGGWNPYFRGSQAATALWSFSPSLGQWRWVTP